MKGVDDDIFTDANGKATDAEGNPYRKTQGMKIEMTGSKAECTESPLKLTVNVMCD